MFGVTVWEVFTLCEHPWPNMTAAEVFKFFIIVKALLKKNINYLNRF